ncbi:beta-alanine transporter-like [Paramacrobiotus metropolitanus]|uniref:beta-alanine transporter-like n=1 Tax=Paramacrobiotus metropolitanus TaxID=2943436 RepID=UPI00244628A9|nr:beta-alanine transporter-like [Paramacrobiotus metropolitanus]
MSSDADCEKSGSAGKKELLPCYVNDGTETLSEEKSSDFGAQFDELLVAVGKFGRYQQFVILVVLLPSIFAYAFSNGFWLFIIASPDKFWCRSGDNVSDFNLTANGDQQCTVHSIAMANASDSVDRTSVPIAPCASGWDYDKTYYYSTIVTEWDLVCSHDFLATLMYIITSVVGTLAAPLGGWCSDHYGRKSTYFGFLAVEIVSGIAVSLSPSYWIFVVLASVHSIAVYPTYQTLYTLGLEILSPDYRTKFAVMLSFAYALGACACCGLSFFLRDWRMIILSCSLPVASLFGFWWVMPESPRFLLSQRRFRKVELYFRRAAKWNRVNFEVECREKLCHLFESLSTRDVKAKEKSYSFKHLLICPKLRRRLFVLMYLSGVVAVCYGGLGFYAPQLGTNPYLNVFLTSLVDLPAALLTQLVADKLGRRLTLLLDFVLGGLACLATLLFPQTEDYYFATLVLFLMARMFAVSSYTVEELVSCENFPTVVRGEGISLTNGVSGIVSNLGPTIVYLFVGNALATPMAWFGGITILASFIVFFIPETVDKPLPETLDDFEDFTVVQSVRELFVHLK